MATPKPVASPLGHDNIVQIQRPIFSADARAGVSIKSKDDEGCNQTSVLSISYMQCAMATSA